MDVRLDSTGLKCIENPNVCSIEELCYFTTKEKFNWTTGIYLLFVRSEENFWKLPLLTHHYTPEEIEILDLTLSKQNAKWSQWLLVWQGHENFQLLAEVISSDIRSV